MREDIRPFMYRSERIRFVIALLLLWLPAVATGQQREAPVDAADEEDTYYESFADEYADLTWEPREQPRYVVTGSWLRRRPSDAPWLLSVLGKPALDAFNATDLRGLVDGLAYDSASIGAADAFRGADGSMGNAAINLRNLGVGTTLVLVDGKRLMATGFDRHGSGYTDLSGLVPLIALDRVEVVRGSAAAVYGLEATAGVVNFATRLGFEGVELQADYGVDDETGLQSDILLAALFGARSARGEMLVAFEYLRRDPLRIGDRYSVFGRSVLSTHGQPGSYVPVGAIAPAPSFFATNPSQAFGSRHDLDCRLEAARDGRKATQGNISQAADGACVYDMSSFFNLVGEEDNARIHFAGRYRASQLLTLRLDVFHVDTYFYRDSPLFADITPGILGVDHPGLQLDAQRRGIEPVPYLVAGRVLGGSEDTAFALRPVATGATAEREFQRIDAGFSYDMTLFRRAFRFDFDVSHFRRNLVLRATADVVESRLDAAYRGFGGPGCNPGSDTAGSGNFSGGNCFYYNPFATARFDPVSGALWDRDDDSPWSADPRLTTAEAAQRYTNPEHLLLWLVQQQRKDSTADQWLIDVVLAGELFGASEVALGFQWRREQLETDLDEIANENDYSASHGGQDFRGDSDLFSVFAEVHWPFSPRLHLDVAGRYEDASYNNTNSLAAEAGLMWRFADSLTLRGNVSASVRIPSLMQTDGYRTVLLGSTDPFAEFAGPVYRPVLVEPNVRLLAEEGTAYNLGLSFAPPTDGPIGGLSLDLGFFYHDRRKPVVGENHQALIDLDSSMRCPDGVNRDAGQGPLCGAAGTAVDSIGEGLPDRVVRDINGNIRYLETSYVNADSLAIAGVDLDVRYQFGIGPWNRFALRLMLMYMLQYDFTTSAGVTIDGLGKRNADNGIGRPVPKLEGSLSAYWHFGRRSQLSATVNHVGGYRDTSGALGLRSDYLGAVTDIDAWTTFDVQYNLRLPALFSRRLETDLTLGVKNLLGENPPRVDVDGAYEPRLHDPRGRVWHARLTVGF